MPPTTDQRPDATKGPGQGPSSEKVAMRLPDQRPRFSHDATPRATRIPRSLVHLHQLAGGRLEVAGTVGTTTSARLTIGGAEFAVFASSLTEQVLVDLHPESDDDDLDDVLLGSPVEVAKQLARFTKAVA